MSKPDLIERIMKLNRSARQEFLDGFSERELSEYLAQLEQTDLVSLWAGIPSAVMGSP